MSEIKYDSLLEIALEEVMKKAKKPKSISKIAQDVFQQKGYTKAQAEQAMGQFVMDFMLCGKFICCGEDPKTKEKLWDLKNRQPFSLIEKDGNSLDDPYEDDEDVVNNELTNETQYENDNYDDKNIDDDDDDEEKEEHDEIEEELGMFEDVEATMKCPYCGQKISVEDNICPFCENIIAEDGSNKGI